MPDYDGTMNYSPLYPDPGYTNPAVMYGSPGYGGYPMNYGCPSCPFNYGFGGAPYRLDGESSDSRLRPFFFGGFPFGFGGFPFGLGLGFGGPFGPFPFLFI